MKKLVFVVVALTLLFSMVTPAFADDGPLDQGNTVTVTKSKDASDSSKGSGILPMYAHPVPGGGSWEADLSGNLTWITAHSKSWKEGNSWAIDHITCYAWMYNTPSFDDEHLIGYDGQSLYNTATATAADTFALEIGDHEGDSSHSFAEQGYQSWSTNLYIH